MPDFLRTFRLKIGISLYKAVNLCYNVKSMKFTAPISISELQKELFYGGTEHYYFFAGGRSP